MATLNYKPNKKIFKKGVASLVFKVLGRAIKACYRLDSRAKKDLDSLPEGITIRLFVKPCGPQLILKKEAGKINILKECDNIELDIHFKSIENALLALTGQKSVATCYCEQRMAIFGDIVDGMKFVRVMNVVEAYLFPRLLTSHIFNKQAPKRERFQLRILIATLFGI